MVTLQWLAKYAKNISILDVIGLPFVLENIILDT